MGCCVTLELHNLALSEYSNFPFNSMCVHQGVCYGASDLGVYILDSGGTDDGADIDASIKTGLLDNEVENPKTVRAVVVEFESTDDMLLTVWPDEGVSEVRTLVNELDVGKQKSAVSFFPRDQVGSYWSFQVANVRGGDFSLDKLIIYFNIMAYKYISRAVHAVGVVDFPEITVIGSPNPFVILDFPEITILGYTA